MTAPCLMPLPKQQYLSALGAPLVGGKVWTYAAGTTDLKPTYTDAAGTVAQPNPIPLNARGEPTSPIFWDGSYRVDVRDSLGNLVYTVDNYSTDPNGFLRFLTSAGASLIGFIQSIAGAVARTVQDKLAESVSVYDFMTAAQIADARSGAPVLDHTAAVQAALDSLPKVLNFNADGTFRVGVLNIKGPCEIRGNGCSLLASGLGIFNAVAAMPFLSIHGFKNVAWVAGEGVGVTGRQFFWNGNNAAGSTAYGAATTYPITDLQIYDNVLGSCKIECFGLTTVSRVYRNRWAHAAGVGVAPAYLYLERGTTDDNAGPVYVEDNFFDVYPPDGIGKSILKVTGGITDAQIHRNYLRNNNNNCLAQLDVFTGAHKMRLTGNTLIDTQLHRKQVKGSTPAAPTLYQLDFINGNTFESRPGSNSNTPFYFIGALATITGNQFKLRNATVLGYAIQLDPSDVDIGFDTNGPVANIISNNIFDLRGTVANCAHLKVASPSIGASGTRLLIVSGNIALGGSYFLQGGAQINSVTFGNVWGYSTSAIGFSINGSSANNLMIGNVVDSQAPVLAGNTRGNLANLTIPTLDATTATPDVSAGDIFNVNSATAITGFTGGYVGKKITIFNLGQGTFTPGNNLKLSGNVVFSFTTFGDSLTLMQTTAAGRWVEVGRCKNS